MALSFSCRQPSGPRPPAPCSGWPDCAGTGCPPTRSEPGRAGAGWGSPVRWPPTRAGWTGRSPSAGGGGSARWSGAAPCPSASRSSSGVPAAAVLRCPSAGLRKLLKGWQIWSGLSQFLSRRLSLNLPGNGRFKEGSLAGWSLFLVLTLQGDEETTRTSTLCSLFFFLTWCTGKNVCRFQNIES